MEFWNGDESSEMYTLQNEGWCVNGMDYTVYAHGYMHLSEDGGFLFFFTTGLIISSTLGWQGLLGVGCLFIILQISFGRDMRNTMPEGM